MFLVYINDINEFILSSIRLFADDYVVYNTISTPRDAEQLQDDLNHTYAWSEKWQMKLNTDKCVLLKCTRSLAPIQYTYTLNDQALISKSQYPYLGIVFNSSVSWSTHIQIVGNRAMKILNFVKQNLTNCSTTIKNKLIWLLLDPLWNTPLQFGTHTIILTSIN